MRAEDRSGSEVVESLLPFVPPPAQGPVLLGTGLVLGLARARQLKRALRSLAEGIEAASKEDPRVRESLEATSASFERQQTETAKKMMSRVREGTPPLRVFEV